MAKQIITTELVLDDLDGTEGAETVRFAYNGELLEIDVAGKNEAQLAKINEMLAKFAEHARKVPTTPNGAKSARGATSSRPGNGLTKDQSARIRDWAPTVGWEVAPRGRLPREVVDAYFASGGR